MDEVLAKAEEWRAAGEQVALATVVGTRRSAPRPVGSKLAICGNRLFGSVSGGCVEGAVVGEALAILAGEKDRRIVTFGYSDDEAFAVGLTCGGTIHLFIERLTW